MNLYSNNPVVVNEITVVGSEPFKVAAQSFIISPLNDAAELCIKSIHKGVDDPKKILDINPGEYTQVTGLCTNIELFVNTTETFYIKQY